MTARSASLATGSSGGWGTGPIAILNARRCRVVPQQDRDRWRFTLRPLCSSLREDTIEHRLPRDQNDQARNGLRIKKDIRFFLLVAVALFNGRVNRARNCETREALAAGRSCPELG